MHHQELQHSDYYEEGNFLKGLTWGIMLSIPLWLSFFGWIKIIRSFLV